MRKRLVLGTLAAVFMLIFPVSFSPSSGENPMNSAPFATVAIAGHITPGGRYCACDGQCLNNLTVSPSDEQENQDTKNEDDTAIDPSVMVTLALLLFFGMRS